jgi:hypothetical protein
MGAGLASSTCVPFVDVDGLDVVYGINGASGARPGWIYVAGQCVVGDVVKPARCWKAATGLKDGDGVAGLEGLDFEPLRAWAWMT